MALTSIGSQKTPGRPIEITFAAETGTPSAVQEVLLIGHKDAASGSATVYEVVDISNVSDEEAATTEANSKFGEGSELALMVIAAVKANAGRSTFPSLKACPLASSDTDFGTADIALTNVKRVKAEFVVSPYDADDVTLRDALADACEAMSGAQRVQNNQFGSIGVAANRDVSDPASLLAPDTQYLSLVWMPDSGTPDYSLGELAAAYAAVVAGNGVPFNPTDNAVIGGVDAPADSTEWITVGGGLESETALEKGWTPLRVLPNGDVAIVRAVTTRITTGDGVTAVSAYYDVQDFQVLYYWRKTLFTRFNQSDFSSQKASVETAKNIKSEVIRLAQAFEDQNMFQSVSELAKSFVVERNASDRNRFDVFTPVNVIPGLHVIATNVNATTEFDAVTV